MKKLNNKLFSDEFLLNKSDLGSVTGGTIWTSDIFHDRISTWSVPGDEGCSVSCPDQMLDVLYQVGGGGKLPVSSVSSEAASTTILKNPSQRF